MCSIYSEQCILTADLPCSLPRLPSFLLHFYLWIVHILVQDLAFSVSSMTFNQVYFQKRKFKSRKKLVCVCKYGVDNMIVNERVRETVVTAQERSP